MGAKYSVVVTKGAEKDIKEIFDYLSVHAFINTAENVVHVFFEEMTKLEDRLHSFGLLKGIESKFTYRRILKWSYRIIFL